MCAKACISAVSVRELRKVFTVREAPNGEARAWLARLCKGVLRAFPPLWKRVPRVALDGISLSVAEGEIYGLLGANGSGKSTLLRILNTVLYADAGEVRIFDCDIVRDAQRVREIVTRVGVDPALYKGLSARENLAFTARLFGLAPGEAVRRCIALLKTFGFEDRWLDIPVAQLSRGNMQKVAICRACMSLPAVLILDEPTTGLDPVARAEVNTFVRNARDEHGVTILLATHDMWQAAELCDRIGVMHRGQLIAEGSCAGLMAMAPGADDLEEAYKLLTGNVLGD